MQQEKPNSAKLETYKDLILKAQNLTLQRDRLQASQILLRGLAREKRGSVAYRELLKALDELTGLFYTEKAQMLHSAAEAMMDSKPREAADVFQEALRIEDGNLTILKSMARAYLLSLDCDKADTAIKAAEGLHSQSAEVKLLRLQTLDCQKKFDLLSSQLASKDPDLEPLEKWLRSLELKELIRKGDLKKAKTTLVAWEAQDPDFPEVYFWKWEISRQTGATDRSSAVKYSQLCQNLTPRRRRTYLLDVNLCRGKSLVDQYLKESGYQNSAPTEQEEGD